MNIKWLKLSAVLAALAAAVLAAPAHAEEGRPLITSYSEKEIGNDVGSWTAVQDPDGVIYFGADKVLAFDGSKWRRYPVPGTYAVLGLAVGEKGRLWISGINELGYFDKTDRGLSEYHSLVAYLDPKDRELGQVWQVLIRGPDVVFVAPDKVLVWNGARFQVSHFANSRRIVAVMVDRTIFLHHTPTGIWQLDDTGLHSFIGVDVIGRKGMFLIERQAGGWMLATNEGIFHFENGALTEDGSPEISEFLHKNILVAAKRSPSGELYLGTLFGGLLVLDPTCRTIERVLGPEEGLPSRGVYSLLFAKDHTLWTTSPVGIAHVSIESGVTLFDSRDGLTGQRILSFATARSRLLAVTEEGVFAMDLGSRGPGTFGPMRALSKGIVTLEKGPNESVYASGFKRVSRLDNEDLTELFTSKTDTNILHLSRSFPGSLVAANSFDILRLSPSLEGTFAATALGHLPDLPRSLAEDGHGNLWVGTYGKGAFVVPGTPGAGVDPIKPSQMGGLPLDGSTVTALVGDRIALFTDKGLTLFAGPGETGLHVGAAPAAPALAVSNSDSSGAVWVAFKGPFPNEPTIPVVGRLAAPRSGQPTWEAFQVPGLSQVGSIGAIYVDERGIVWLGGVKGILRLDPPRLRSSTPPGKPAISSTISQGARLPWDRNSMDFEFSCVQFGGPETYRFQTRLSAGTGDWSAPTDNTHLSLAGLRDGHYEFSVRVTNDAGMVGPPATLSFTVLPPWYRTAPAVVLFTLALAAGVFGSFKWRLAFLKRQNARLEMLVQKKTAQLEKANEAKSEFLANMSHEIRNPISGILGLAIAFEETQLDKRQRHLVDSINSCANLLAALVDDVLDFSKIEAGRIELRSAPFSVRVLLEQCVAMIVENAKAAGSTISIEVDDAVPGTLVGDSARVQQIVLNYLTNALKFGAGKPITVGALCGIHDRVRFFVRDQGMGMTEAEISTLFTKFTRLESARAGNIRGTGLGLAVSRLLATKMGGRVGVESEPGKGSQFWAELPFLTVNGSSAGKGANVTSPGTLRALIVEDIDYNVIAMQAVLRKLDIQSDVVNDGTQALERLQSSHYDVAFLDWNLPGMIGTEVAARYRAVEPSTRRTIIIATTAHSSDMNKEACLQAGMDAFISKPITPGKIAAALSDLGGPLRTAASIEVRSQHITFEAPGEIDLEMLTFLGTETLEGLSGQIDRFLASFDSDRGAARRIIDSGEPSEIHRIAHRLLSHCSVVKYERLGSIARDIQIASGTATRSELQGMFARFETEFAAFKCKLESIRASTVSA